MINSIMIITNDVIFPNYFINLLVGIMNAVHIVVCDSFDDIDDQLTNSNCSFILLDGALTRFSSIEIIYHLRYVSHTTVPIWFFPEVHNEGYINKSIEVGATRIIKKPFNPHVICREIKIFFEGENVFVTT